MPEPERDDLEREMDRILDEYRARVLPAGPVALSDDYLRLVHDEEVHPDNRSGTDKTWVERARVAFRVFHDSIE